MATISLLYDVCICIYLLESEQWRVFSESARRGYVCLLNSVGHFNVLNGVCGPPVIPLSAHTHAIGGRNLETSKEEGQCLLSTMTIQIRICSCIPPTAMLQSCRLRGYACNCKKKVS